MKMRNDEPIEQYVEYFNQADGVSLRDKIRELLTDGWQLKGIYPCEGETGEKGSNLIHAERPHKP